MVQTQEQQRQQWGRDLAATLGAWPRLQQLANVGITANPADLVPILVNDSKQTASLAAFFDLIESSLDHHTNQADADNHE